MKRRDVLRKTVATGAIVTGAASVASAAGSSDEQYVVQERGGEQVAVPLSETDVEPEDHCHEYCCEDCGDHPCGDQCVCEVWCHM